jgi:Raf kinase inhibitor-like YbhB/YbcL family protein
MVFVYDPDAGFDSGATVEQGFVHWIVFNIPPATTGYSEGMPGGDTLSDGALQGSNDFAPYGAGTFPGGAAINLVGYDGPCPGGEHGYVFTLYALDAFLDLAAGTTPTEILDGMEGHVLAEAEVMGLFAPPD